MPAVLAGLAARTQHSQGHRTNGELMCAGQKFELDKTFEMCHSMDAPFAPSTGTRAVKDDGCFVPSLLSRRSGERAAIGPFAAQ